MSVAVRRGDFQNGRIRQKAKITVNIVVSQRATVAKNGKKLIFTKRSKMT